MSEKILVALVQLGSPKSPKTSDVRVYLKNFLGDPRVVDINPFVWKIILNLFVLPFRPKKSGALYARIWDGESFPLITLTQKLAKKVDAMTPDEYDVVETFLLSEPGFDELFDKYENGPYRKILVVPMFPQYSESTIASAYDLWSEKLKHRIVIPRFEFIPQFYKLRSFISLSVKKIREHIDSHHPDMLVISFHGIPLRRVLQKKDPYYYQCAHTYESIKQELGAQIPIHMTFQSRFGSEEWLGPYTDEYIDGLIEDFDGTPKIAVYCPSFVTDCLETIDEIGTELPEEFEGRAEISLVPCLNDDDDWAKGLSEYITAVENKTEHEQYIDEIPGVPAMPDQKPKSAPLSDKAKSAIKIVFLTLFLDLVGFSIIFPMFPALAKWYTVNDPDNFFLKLIFDNITNLLTFSESSNSFTPIVLFGGVLGALYSLLEFIAAPIWGSTSDKIGRRPALLISVAGLGLSYALWAVSGSFTLLILARIIGGLMGGNLSVATAVVSDVTEKNNRSKGMAFVGIAFALGFIIGPALGGILSLIDLSQLYPSLVSYGINPFSVPAIFACVLSVINLYLIYKKLPETLPEKVETTERTNNILKLFKPLPYKGLNATNLSYFLFISAFSGMEFTLTFLAVERLSYTSMSNAYMFIFIGVLIALVQGGFVRRRAHDIGEKKVTVMGLILLIPGLLSIAYANSSALLYVGLFFLSIGSAMIIPCMTSLVSFYAPSDVQGQAIGTFRSLGSLGRVIGPLIASVVYWKLGSSYPYILGAAFLVLPILLVMRLPNEEPLH